MYTSYPNDRDSEQDPFQTDDLPVREVDIDVTVTMHRTVRMKLDDYKATTEMSEDGEFYETEYDYSDCDFDSALDEADVLPEGWEFDEILFEYP